VTPQALLFVHEYAVQQEHISHCSAALNDDANYAHKLANAQAGLMHGMHSQAYWNMLDEQPGAECTTLMPQVHYNSRRAYTE